MPSWKRAIGRLGLELGYFTGIARLLAPRMGGIGVVLKFTHVRPFEPGRLDPQHAITPRFLDRLLKALDRWQFDIVSLDEMTQRLSQPPGTRRRFVCLTFDGGFRDFVTHAWPLLKKQNAPFALFVPSNAPDGNADLWWLALERIIRENSRVSLMFEESERHFNVGDLRAKRELFRMLFGWLRSVPQKVRAEAMNELCARYSIDVKAVCNAQCLSWSELSEMSASPLATIGSATVSYPVLAHSLNDAAEREMSIGRTVIEASLGRPARHFAYPFGDARSYGRRHAMMAGQLGFATACTSEPGVIMPGRTDVLNLPRIAWDGRRNSLRLMRVILTGVATIRFRRRRLAD